MYIYMYIYIGYLFDVFIWFMDFYDFCPCLHEAQRTAGDQKRRSWEKLVAEHQLLVDQGAGVNKRHLRNG